MDYKQQFVESLKEIGNYYANYGKMVKEEALDGALFSTLTLIDGVNNFNDFNSLIFIDGLAGDELNRNIELHDMLDTTGENVLIDDLKEIRDYWKNSPDVSVRQAMDGMMTSICGYFAGQYDLNGNTILDVVEYIDNDNFVEWNCSDLHEMYAELDKIKIIHPNFVFWEVDYDSANEFLNKDCELVEFDIAILNEEIEQEIFSRTKVANDPAFSINSLVLAYDVVADNIKLVELRFNEGDKVSDYAEEGQELIKGIFDEIDIEWMKESLTEELDIDIINEYDNLRIAPSRDDEER